MRKLCYNVKAVSYRKCADSPQIKYGGIAQLGERLNGIQEVSGSIPLISTTKVLKTSVFGTFSFAFRWFYLLNAIFSNRAATPDFPATLYLESILNQDDFTLSI